MKDEEITIKYVMSQICHLTIPVDELLNKVRSSSLFKELETNPYRSLRRMFCFIFTTRDITKIPLKYLDIREFNRFLPEYLLDHQLEWVEINLNLMCFIVLHTHNHLSGVQDGDLGRKIHNLLTTRRQRNNAALLNLAGTTLSGIKLLMAGLNYANMEYFDLGNADLDGAEFAYTNLFHANLRKANLDGRVNFTKTNLEGANLREITYQYIYGPFFQSTNLKNAILTNIDCTQIHWDDADLEGADLSNLKDAANLISLLKAKNLDKVKFLALTDFDSSDQLKAALTKKYNYLKNTLLNYHYATPTQKQIILLKQTTAIKNQIIQVATDKKSDELLETAIGDPLFQPYSLWKQNINSIAGYFFREKMMVFFTTEALRDLVKANAAIRNLNYPKLI